MTSRRRPKEEHENHERWLVSYADFITLMFAFFTVMYATAQRNPEKEKQFEKSVRKYLYSVSAGMNGGTSFNDQDFGTTPIAPPIEMPRSSSRGALESLRDSAEVAKVIEGVYHDSVGIRIRLLASALFATGSSQINEESLEALKKIGAYLQTVKGRIIVEGHTDDRPIKSNRFASNWELSADRAAKIVRYLIDFHEIEAKNLVAVSYADQKPIYPNTNEGNRSKNRRIEILITSEQDSF